jgi:hypothetical protein
VLFCRRLFSLFAVGVVLVACSGLPGKDEALALVQAEAKEDTNCTLPISIMPLLKMQHTTKAVCVPREQDPAGKKTFDDTMACLNALVTAGATTAMPPNYMSEWPDEVAGSSFNDVNAYDRRARMLMFKGCVAMGDGLRNGQFKCAQAKADAIVRTSKIDDTHAKVTYSRTLTFDASLAAIEKVCGTVTRPGPDAMVVLEKTADKKWHVAATQPSP